MLSLAKRIGLVVLRSLVVWAFHALALLAVHLFVPGVRLEAPGLPELAVEALTVALVLAGLNVSIRPSLVWLTLPVNVFTLGFFTLVINALMLEIVSWVLPFVEVANLASALVASLVISSVSTFLGSVTALNSHFSFFDGVVEWLGVRLMPRFVGSERGIVVVEIDGLSHGRLLRALEKGLMPYLQTLLRDGHVLSPYDCGIPSQTSSSQAGLMFGRDDDIPGFRWYDKKAKRVVSSRNPADARAIEDRVAGSNGLLRGGSSINNNLSGGAYKTVLTASRGLDTAFPEQQRGLQDLYLYFLNPYLFPRSLVLALVEMAREIVQSVLRRVRRQWPRLDRVFSRFPAERAACTVLLRDVGTFVAVMDILRGLPAIYVTYMGYDEVAHHAGPDSREALSILRGIDKQIKRIHGVVRARAPRPYDLFVLSDHGQGAGATFRQRYGTTLGEFVDFLLRRQGRAVQATSGRRERLLGRELAREMELLEPRLAAEGVKVPTLAGARRLLEAERKEEVDEASEVRIPEEPDMSAEADVVVCPTGNLAHLYFTAWMERISTDALEARFPGFIRALTRHPGIGVVVGRDDAGRFWAYGKEGDRCLDDDLVIGEDPLQPYGRPGLRSQQLRRLASFEHSGDLIVFSSVYEDGSVASFEDLIGSHGGMGGGQTDAFIVHPADVAIPPTMSAADLYPVLAARRGEPAPAGRPPDSATALKEDSIAQGVRPPTVLAAIRRPRQSLVLLARCLVIDRSAFRELAEQPDLTGLSMCLGSLICAAYGVRGAISPFELLPRNMSMLAGLGQGFLTWIGLTFLGWLILRLAGHKIKAGAALRVLTFAQTPLILMPMVALPGAGPALSILIMLWVVLGFWAALSVLGRLPTGLWWLSPIAGAAVMVGSASLVAWAAGAFQFTLSWLLEQLGLL